MKIFISHAHENDALAKKLGKALKRVGWDVWDDEQILPGDNPAEKIGQALEESEAIVVLLTPEAVQSNMVRSEISYALGKKRFSGRLIPVIVGSRDGFRHESLPWILRTLNPIQLPESGQGEAEGIRQIAEALQAVA